MFTNASLCFCKSFASLPSYNCGSASTGNCRGLHRHRWSRGASDTHAGRGRRPCQWPCALPPDFSQQSLTLAFASGINGVCFDRECAQAADRVFAAVTAAPLFGLLCAILYALRPGADQEVRSEDLPMMCGLGQQRTRFTPIVLSATQEGGFQDPDTGAVFRSTDGTQPERDRKVIYHLAADSGA